MDMIVCPHCKSRVVSTSHGECPACRKGIDDRPDPGAEGPPHRPTSTTGRASPAGEAAASLVTIETFELEAEAEEARAYLEGQGVPAFLMDAHTVGMNWVLGNTVGYIKLQVPSDQADSASDLLRGARTARTDGDTFPDEGAAVEDDEETADSTGVLDSLRGMKRPVIWLLLSPLVVGLGLAVIAAIVWFLRWVLGAGGKGGV
jgi:hypothetical protein